MTRPQIPFYMLKSILVYFFILCISLNTNLSAQYGISLNTPDALESYTLFETFTGSFLINNCGEVVNEWPIVSYTENHTKLLENGNIIYIKNNTIFERNWDDEFVRATSTDESNLKIDYEVIVLSNGNYLCIARRLHDDQWFIDKGFNPSFPIPMYNDAIVEIVPMTGEIVWEWNVFDHVIQQRNSSAGNFGVLSENPGKLDMDVNPFFDWSQFGESFMINGFDYNEDLDQIVVSLRKIGEIGIIDHSTTTTEARGSSGGKYGKGGDFLYRWGNPQNYGRGNASDQVLYYQHNPNWIEYGEHKDKIIIYNNGFERDFNDNYSTIEIIEPPIDSEGNYSLENNQAFQPKETSETYGKYTTNTFFFSDYTSGAKVLPNENILITVGMEDRLLEIDPNGKTVWEYNVYNSSYIFRSEKYPVSYKAFEGRDLTPDGYVENPVSLYDCELYTVSTTEVDAPIEIKLLHSSNNFLLKETNGIAFEYQCFNLNGQLVFNSLKPQEFHKLSKEKFNTGFYFFRILSKDKKHISVIKAFVE